MLGGAIGLRFSRKAEFWANVVKTALRNYVQDRLQNRADHLQRETLKETQGPERVTKSDQPVGMAESDDIRSAIATLKESCETAPAVK